MLATHWDGHPASLGKELMSFGISVAAILRIAEKHTIDAADASIRKDLNRQRIRKHQLAEEETGEEFRCGDILTAEDAEISDLRDYGDRAEYQYDIRGEVVLFRPLTGPFPESIENAETFKVLTPNRASAR